MEAKKFQDIQSKPEKEKQCWPCYNARHQVTLQSHSNKSSMESGDKLNPLSYRHLIFKRNVKNMHRRIVVSLTNGGQKKSTCKRVKLGLYCSFSIKIGSECIKELNVRLQSMNLAIGRYFNT